MNSEGVLQSKRKKPGPRPLEEKHLNVIQFITEYLEQNTAAAHLRRRDATMYTNGVTLKNIVDFLRREKNIKTNKHTVHRLMNPMRKGTSSSKRFKSLINARIPPKNNGGEKMVHSDFHYTCVQVNIVNDFMDWPPYMFCTHLQKYYGPKCIVDSK